MEEIPTAPHSHVVTVSPDGGHYSEPSIAINPRNPKQVVVVFQGGELVQGPANAAYSTDGGLSFTAAQGTADPNWKVLGDVTTTFDNFGGAYLCSICIRQAGDQCLLGSRRGEKRNYCSPFPGWRQSLGVLVSNVKTFSTGTEPDIEFEDEPRIYADNSQSSPHAGALYVGWVEWQLTQSVMFFSRSTDHAKTWSKPLESAPKRVCLGTTTEVLEDTPKPRSGRHNLCRLVRWKRNCFHDVA